MSLCPFKKLFQNENGILIAPFKSQDHSKKSPCDQTQMTLLMNKYYGELRDSEEKELISLIDMNEGDLQNLMKLKPILEESAQDIVDSFYNQLLKSSHLKNIIYEHSTVERLKMTFKNYLMDMVSGEVGEEYIHRRKVIGNVHNRIGLYPEWYIGAYSIIQNEILNLLISDHDWEEASKIFQSFQKLCSFDMQLVISTYIQSYTSCMMKMNEMKELQFTLNESSLILATTAEQTTSLIEEKQRKLIGMLEGIYEIQDSSVETISRTENGKRNVSESLSKVDEVVGMIQSTKGLTVELTDSSMSIGQVVKTIRGISNQTNILSLNAAIEAARAGVHGKGFSIVAQEVRKLARQTEDALDDIQSQVTAVQQIIETFDKSYQEIVNETGRFRDINQNIMDILDNTIKSVMSNNNQISHLGKAVEDFEMTFKEIAKASYGLSSMAEQLSSLNVELTEKLN